MRETVSQHRDLRPLTPGLTCLISTAIEMKAIPNHDELALALRALAHPNRLAIFDRIHEDGLCCQSDAKGNTVCAIAEDFDLALSTVSHHLKELRDANLITCERRGQQIVCGINYETLGRVLALLSGKRAAPRPQPRSKRRPRS